MSMITLFLHESEAKPRRSVNNKDYHTNVPGYNLLMYFPKININQCFCVQCTYVHNGFYWLYMCHLYIKAFFVPADNIVPLVLDPYDVRQEFHDHQIDCYITFELVSELVFELVSYTYVVNYFLLFCT